MPNLKVGDIVVWCDGKADFNEFGRDAVSALGPGPFMIRSVEPWYEDFLVKLSAIDGSPLSFMWDNLQRYEDFNESSFRRDDFMTAVHHAKADAVRP